MLRNPIYMTNIALQEQFKTPGIQWERRMKDANKMFYVLLTCLFVYWLLS